MSAGIAVPLEEYLAHTYELDWEYVDGQIVERSVGEYFHSLFQATLGYYLVTLLTSTRYSFRVLSSCRAKVSATDRYRTPDLSIVPLRSAPTSIILEPPLAVVEILSPEDRFNSVVQKCADYEAFGIPEVWLVDPLTKEIWTVRHGEAIPVPDRITSFSCNEGEVRVDFNEVFANRHLN